MVINWPLNGHEYAKKVAHFLAIFLDVGPWFLATLSAPAAAHARRIEDSKRTWQFERRGQRAQVKDLK